MPMVRPVSSIAEVAHSAGRRTAFIYNWEQLRDLAEPGTLDFSYYKNYQGDDSADITIAHIASEYIVNEQPDFCFVYFGLVDVIGHQHGWMSSEYLAQIENSDLAIGIVLERLREADLLDRYFMLLQSDHGGHGQSHGTDMPEDLTIPWIAAGPNVKPMGEIDQLVRIIDTAPTIAYALDLPLVEAWEGEPITAIFK
jgi:phosphopentomutase